MPKLIFFQGRGEGFETGSVTDTRATTDKNDPSLIWARPSLAKSKFGQVRVSVTGDAFTQTRLMSVFRFNGPSCGASPAEGRRHMKVC